MKVLLLNQCFYPDLVSTAQHLTDLAVGLSDAGHDVTVIASDRGYDDARKRFPRHETWSNIKIIRIPSLSLGKKSKWRRAVNFASFSLICALRLLVLRRFDVVIALTSPPLISVLGALFVKLKGGRFFFWVMDLNPDEAIAAGWLREQSIVSRTLKSLLHYSMRHAERIVVLDRYMKQRVVAKGIAEDTLAVIAPWAHNDSIRYDADGRVSFRKAHELSDKYVVMYSGNHSPCHSLDTLLAAALRLANHSSIAFCFVGGGSEYEKVKLFVQQHQLANISCLPYQPLDQLATSLSAADLHVVVMGNAFTGIVHPCKIYNILEIGAPVLYIGPDDSHVADVLSQLTSQELICAARHGDVETVAAHIAREAEKELGRRLLGANNVSVEFSKETLLPKMISLLQPMAGGHSAQSVLSETTV